MNDLPRSNGRQRQQRPRTTDLARRCRACRVQRLLRQPAPSLPASSGHRRAAPPVRALMINTRLAAARHRDVIVLADGLPEMDGVDMILEAGKPTPDGGELR
jgi:hypothetical protein